MSVDLHEQMLVRMRRRVERAGVADRIGLHRARMDRLGVDETVDCELCGQIRESGPSGIGHQICHLA